MTALTAIVASLRDDWGVATEPVGRRGVRFAVTSDQGRPLPMMVTLDLHSEDATADFGTRPPGPVLDRRGKPRQRQPQAAPEDVARHGIVMAAFTLAEAVWMIDPDIAHTSWVVRLEPTPTGFTLVTHEE
ncbi:MAG: hypothetical protein QM708_03075 [Propioniciclava sp.]|uniref:hypothetical protein n=1 Tax=Propioniciclava sp. TaxID=2038686 RepID=UPI0039E488D9